VVCYFTIGLKRNNLSRARKRRSGSDSHDEVTDPVEPFRLISDRPCLVSSPTKTDFQDIRPFILEPKRGGVTAARRHLAENVAGYATKLSG
jgi:hypothetical protein